MMIPISITPASTSASIPSQSTGLFATGTNCLAEVCVIGRRRVPAPPERMSPFRGSIGRWNPTYLRRMLRTRDPVAGLARRPRYPAAVADPLPPPTDADAEADLVGELRA